MPMITTWAVSDTLEMLGVFAGDRLARIFNLPIVTATEERSEGHYDQRVHVLVHTNSEATFGVECGLRALSDFEMFAHVCHVVDVPIAMLDGPGTANMPVMVVSFDVVIETVTAISSSVERDRASDMLIHHSGVLIEQLALKRVRMVVPIA